MLEPCVFTLRVDPSTEAEISAATCAVAASKEEAVVEVGQVRCGVCGAVMAKERYVMHERHCAKRMGKCGTCGDAMLLSSLGKHTAIQHTRLACQCGLHLPQHMLHTHQRADCPARLVKCVHPWCHLLVQQQAAEAHNVACMMKSSPCVVCSLEVPRTSTHTNIRTCMHTSLYACL